MPDYNGYLDSDQTLINYAVREMGGSFQQTIQDDPSRMLRNWLKCRRSAQNTAIGTTLFGALGLVAGVFTGAMPLMIAGVAVAAGSGFLVKHHSEGAAACELESEILDSCRPILSLLAELEQRGANPSDLVSLYDRLIRAASAKNSGFDVTNKAQLQAFFQAELEQSAILSNLSGASHGIAATMKVKPQQQAAPALGNAVENGATPEPPQVSPNRFEPIEPPQIFDIPVEDVPSLQPPSTQPAAAPIDSRTPPPIATTTADDNRFAWAKDLLHFPAVLIWGAQGSGKTSFAAWLLHQRIEAGHSAEVWDVHREYGQWDGLAVYGDGMDYEAVDRRMNAFENQVKADYKERAKNPKFNPKRHTIVCEEFTNFARRCENSAPFFEAALSDLRKVKKGVIFVSHDRSLAALGGSKGFSKARNNGLLELQLEAIIDPTTGDPMPALKGKLRYPGKAAIEVEISPEMRGSMNFTTVVANANSASATTDDQQQLRDRLENLYRETAPENFPDSPEISTEGGNFSTTPENAETQRESDFSAFEADPENFFFSDFQLGKLVFLAVKAEMENGKKKAEIVQDVLECKGRKYKFGCAWFDALIKKYGELN
ncbi:hypothetical protein H6F67_27215 [Microcoleus sp. FACHB-1515]|uniref:hypothetical protein n=1 Tax=Cyanophyceae TaxID=3028117 RepID=UPI001682CB4F|nr:hypothetical protein [Microcoleus sp. FACHB-1515]MBD2093529.1 hypothetical protein [Microcoleus sp. FACHB-1515]